MFLGNSALQPQVKLIQQTPTWAHWWGRDAIGRDFLCVCADGTIRSLTYAVICCFLSMGLGTLLGLSAALKGGIVDRLLLHISDTFRSMELKLIILILNASDLLNLLTVYGVCALFFSMQLTYQMRGRAHSLLGQDFIEAAKLLGASNTHIGYTHLMPHIYPFLFLNFVDSLRHALLTEGFIYAIGLNCGDTICLGGLMSSTMYDEACYYDPRYFYLKHLPEVVFVIILYCIYQIGLCSKEVIAKNKSA